jgi:beta-N-acetylhexosaminidase
MKKLFLLLFCTISTLSLTAQIFITDAELKQQIAQMLLIGFRGTELTPQHTIYSDIKNLGIGGVILFEYDVPSRSRPRNIKSPSQLAKLTKDMQAIAPVKLFVSIDQEGGKINRLRTTYGFPATVSAHYQGQVNNPDTTAYYADQTAVILEATGFNLNFAPCVDVNINPLCPIIGKLERSFSADPAIVTQHAGIWLDEQKKKGIIGCIKHFPGHGSSTVDTHLGIADVTRTWQKKELDPYRDLIKAGKVDMVMISHVYNAKLDNAYPATMSRMIITGILREQLGFDGVIVTDDLAMGAMTDHYSLEDILIHSILAGADLLCLSNNGTSYDPEIAKKAVDIIFKAVKDRKINQTRIMNSYNRILRLKARM